MSCLPFRSVFRSHGRRFCQKNQRSGLEPSLRPHTHRYPEKNRCPGETDWPSLLSVSASASHGYEHCSACSSFEMCDPTNQSSGVSQKSRQPAEPAARCVLMCIWCIMCNSITSGTYGYAMPLLLLSKLQLFKRIWKAEIIYIKTAIPINNAS